MKKLTVLSIAFFFSFSLMFGQVGMNEDNSINETKKELKAKKKELKKLEGDDISFMAKDNFNVDFGNIPDVQWNRDGFYDVATFMKDGKEMKAFYDFDSELVGTTHEITFADLPKSAQKEINKKYSDYDIGPIIFFDNNEAIDGLILLYGIEFESADNYFVELTKGTKKIVLQVLDSGELFFFKDMK